MRLEEIHSNQYKGEKMAETFLSIIENFVGPFYELLTFALMLGFSFGLTRNVLFASALCIVFCIALVFLTGSAAFGYGAIAFTIIVLTLKLLGF